MNALQCLTAVWQIQQLKQRPSWITSRFFAYIWQWLAHENELALATMASIHDLPQTEFSTAIQNIFLATDEDLVASCRLMYQDEWFRSLDMNANDDLLAQLGMLRNYGYPTTALQRRMCPFQW
ncbi:MAG: hypothetical protein IPF56_04875 [Chloroflexi bacterium]|nr:hypothetical protein [Chloroflexota bacterium]